VAEVRIPIKRFTSLDFPSVCAVTGLPAEEVFAFAFDGVKGGLPLNKSSVRLVRQQQLTLRLVWAVALVLVALTVILDKPILGIGAAVTVAIILTNFAAIRSRLPRGRIDGKELVLLNVHSGFVDALDNPTSKCAGCPSVNACSTEEKEVCAEHDALTHQS
jgi:hypothetical protein